MTTTVTTAPDTPAGPQGTLATPALRGEARALGPMFVAFAALVLTLAVLSDGFLTADALTHYLYARYAFAEPHYLVNVWGRPLVTALYAGPAAVGGVLGVRIASLFTALACAYASYRIARGQGIRRPELAAVFALGQPLLFLHAFSEMTELPFATLIAFAFWAYQARRFTMVAVLVSLSPLARPEGLGFLLLAAAALAWHRRLALIALLPVPLLVWNHAGWEIFDRPGPWWQWLPSQFPYSANSLYPPGHLLQFVALLPVVVSPLVMPGTVIGTWQALRDGRGWSWWRRLTAESQDVSSVNASRGRDPDAADEKHVAWCRVLTALIPLWILAVHSLLCWLGKLGSFGEARYMLVVAPFWAVLSARGWTWAWERLQWRRPVAWAAAAVVPPLAVAVGLGVLPLRTPDHWRTAEAVANWYQSSGVARDHPRVAASHPAVFYYLGVSPTDRVRAREWHRTTIQSPPAGTLLIWDSLYGPQNATGERAVKLSEIEAAGWVRDEGAERALKPDHTPGGVEWAVFRSPESSNSGDGE